MIARKMITGKMIAEAHKHTRPGDSAAKDWDGCTVDTRVSYMKVAQVLSVRAGLCSETDRRYIAILFPPGEGYDRDMTQVLDGSSLEEVFTAAHGIINDDDIFKVYAIENGIEVGEWRISCQMVPRQQQKEEEHDADSDQPDDSGRPYAGLYAR